MTAAEDLKHASIGFDLVFSNDLDGAKAHLSAGDSPFNMIGLGSLVFLQAALGMETGLMAEASRLLTLAESKARKEIKNAKSGPQVRRRFAPGLDFEVLQADSILLLGFTQALSESYTGYLQCMYSLNSAHTKFTKIYKTAFPDGIDGFATPSSTPIPSRKPSLLDIPQSSSTSISSSSFTSSGSNRSLLGRWGSSSPKSASQPTTPVPIEPDGPVEELIIAGAAFGYGLFNLVLSLLPAKIQGVVGFFGYKSNRRLALRALAVAATREDVHAVFAAVALMSYYGSILMLSGYQADEHHILKQYRAIVDKLEYKYPSGSLWILNRAKILRMTHDPDNAISAMRAGLAPGRPHKFIQADALLVFELAWTLLAQRRYKESADMFMKMTELNTWSHATYYFIAAGCYLSLDDIAQATALLNEVPLILQKRKLGGRDLPTEVFIRKKIAFYKQKAKRRGGTEADWIASIRISPADEMGIFWNVHDRITRATGEAHLQDWLSLSPPVMIGTTYADKQAPSRTGETAYPDLDTIEELTLRSLLVGVVHRSLSRFSDARVFLLDVTKQPLEGSWMRPLAYFELAILHLKESEASNKNDSSQNDTGQSKVFWTKALKEAGLLLDQASELSANTDLSSRLDSRISLLRDEIALKLERTLETE